MHQAVRVITPRTAGEVEPDHRPGDRTKLRHRKECGRETQQPTPRGVITPETRYIMVNSQEEIQEIRRVLLHWPDNVAVSEDWHR